MKSTGKVTNKRMTEAEKDDLKVLQGTLNGFKKEVQQKNEKISELERVEEIADRKIQALNDIHAEKVRSLMNSIQVLRKENAAMTNKGKENIRSKLIQDLQAEVMSQDNVIDILRRVIGNDKKADGEVIKELSKGPPRVRAVTREELRMEIKDLKKKLLRYEKTQGKLGAEDEQTEVNKNEQNDMRETQPEPQIQQIALGRSNEEFISKIGELDNKLEDLKLVVSGKQTEIDKYKQLLSQKNTEIKNLGQYKNDAKFLTMENEKLKEKINELRAQNDREAHSTLTRDVAIKDLEFSGNIYKDLKEKSLETVKTELESWNRKVRDLQQQMAEVTKENAKLSADNKSNAKQLEEAKQRNKDLYAINKGQTEEYNQNQNKDKNNLRDAQIKLKEALRNYESVLAEKKDSDKELAEMKNANHALENKINELNELVQTLESQKRDLSFIDRHQDEESHENQALMESSILDLENKKSGLEIDMNHLEQENTRLKERIKELIQNEIELSDRVDILEQENAFLSRKVVAANLIARGNFNETLSSEATQSHLKDMTTRYESRIKEMTSKIHELEIRNKELEEIQKIMNGSGVGSYKSMSNIEGSMLSESIH